MNISLYGISPSSWHYSSKTACIGMMVSCQAMTWIWYFTIILAPFIQNSLGYYKLEYNANVSEAEESNRLQANFPLTKSGVQNPVQLCYSPSHWPITAKRKYLYSVDKHEPSNSLHWYACQSLRMNPSTACTFMYIDPLGMARIFYLVWGLISHLPEFDNMTLGLTHSYSTLQLIQVLSADV